MIGTTVWDECLCRDKCRAGLKGVYVQHPTLGECTVRCSDWTKEHGGCNLLLGVVPGREEPETAPLATAWGHAVPSLGEILETGLAPAVRFVGADECTLVSRWPVTCCRPTRPPSSLAAPITSQPLSQQEQSMLTDCATPLVWDQPDLDEDLQPLRSSKRTSKAVKATSEPQTVQDAWAARGCRYGLVNLSVIHPTHELCTIALTTFETADATTPTLLLWLVADKDVVSCLTDFHLVPAGECTLTTEWLERCKHR